MHVCIESVVRQVQGRRLGVVDNAAVEPDKEQLTAMQAHIGPVPEHCCATWDLPAFRRVQ
jgi:hypothetical protein